MSIKITGLICNRSQVPEDCLWEEAQELHQYCYNYLLLDDDGLLPLLEKQRLWINVDFSTLQYYYALYNLGIDPIDQYNLDRN